MARPSTSVVGVKGLYFGIRACSYFTFYSHLIFKCNVSASASRKWTCDFCMSQITPVFFDGIGRVAFTITCSFCSGWKLECKVDIDTHNVKIIVSFFLKLLNLHSGDFPGYVYVANIYFRLHLFLIFYYSPVNLKIESEYTKHRTGLSSMMGLIVRLSKPVLTILV